ncbi:hypothetical protein E2C01_023773 [Portunus trituberculatus]|uniref:Uncharacterized protein n=1 Tax=Portunus trituberculatus TaxID=210409 RepID=A0A5B7EBF7_PORTR|nr:hypothetical protein [Portunus trituberculatus]
MIELIRRKAEDERLERWAEEQCRARPGHKTSSMALISATRPDMSSLIRPHSKTARSLTRWPPPSCRTLGTPVLSLWPPRRLPPLGHSLVCFLT